MTALACGLICVGSCNDEVTTTILQTLMEKTEAELKDSPFAKYLPLGIGLAYLGKQEAAEATIATLEVLQVKRVCSKGLVFGHFSAAQTNWNWQNPGFSLR